MTLSKTFLFMANNLVTLFNGWELIHQCYYSDQLHIHSLSWFPGQLRLGVNVDSELGALKYLDHLGHSFC